MSNTTVESSQAEARLRRLVEANGLLVAELCLDALLPRIVESARQVVEAQFGGLGVVADVPRAESTDVGSDVPTTGGAEKWDQGVLGVLVGIAAAVRLPDLSRDPRFSTIAMLTPHVCSFLAVPIWASGSIYAYIYLANPRGGPEFTAEDEHVLSTLAETAGIAVTNAHLYAEARQRQHWSEAAAEVSHQLLGSDPDVNVLDQIAESVARLAEADTVQIVLPVPHDENTLEFAVSRGPGAEQARGLRYPATGSIAWEAMHRPSGLVLDNAQHRVRSYPDARSNLPITNLMAFPLQGKGRSRGSVVVCRANHRRFTAVEVEMARVFTNQATLALELADARADQSRLRLIEDRDCISRELQHLALEKLFQASITLQGAVSINTDPAVRSQLLTTIATLDDTIRSIRSSIFELRTRAVPTPVTVQIALTVARITPALGSPPALHLSGPLDATVDPGSAAELEAALDDCLTAVARQASTSTTTVEINADADTQQLHLCVVTDGGGVANALPAPDLLELRRRTEQRAGHLEHERRIDGGLLLHWTIPLPARGEAAVGTAPPA